AFDSGDAGPLAWVEEGRVRWCQSPLPAEGKPKSVFAVDTGAVQAPRVEIVMNHVNASPLHIDALVQAGVKGLVVAGTGNGSIHTKMKESLFRAQQSHVEIRVSTRCNQGSVIPNECHEFETAGGLSPVKTRVALLLDIMSQHQSH
ncbi:MAG: asparaginase, partial [Betaproteobacteria bacterium]|nr:asparaginase [Betaproteobacteria bacterium]